MEHKELLIKDICPRLPYGLVIDFNGIRTTLHDMKVFQLYDGDVIKDYICLVDVFGDDDYIDVEENIKPYLFPLSSMTEEQTKEMQEIVGSPKVACIMRKTEGLELWLDSVNTDPTIWLDTIFELQDWLNKHHFDWRGLIPKGLANDATGLNIY